jgi:membrane glycosyltransferase
MSASPDIQEPPPREGQHRQLIRKRIVLYLRLLGLAETTVMDLTEKIMQRLTDNTALPVVLSVLQENNIAPDARYHPIFTDAYKPLPRRTPMGYKPANPKNSLHRNKHLTFILGLRRSIFFTLILASTIAGTMMIMTILSPNGMTALKWGIVVIFTFLFGWISINFWTVILGFFLALRKEDPYLRIPKELAPIAPDKKIALVMPVYNEEVPRIFAALRAMHDTIKDAGLLAHFDIYVLSDSTSKAHAIAESLHWAKLCQEVDGFGRIFYRRRKLRLHKKSGNVSDFCRRWGGSYEYMVTLDADSLMGGELLIRMVNIMEERQDIGILQTAPMAMNQTSLIARIQQFSSHTYGPLFFAGLRFWQMDETGFWGHNAIIRMKPFMTYCALPRLGGKPPFGGEIMSHDFVEAALMRRAGWGVWLAHELEDSFEELPPNLLEELSRDKRWCQGNIQHLRLMFMKDLACGHRILFLQGNLFYFSSLLWFIMLILMTANAITNIFHKQVYFAATPSLFPSWTVEYHELSGLLLGATIIFLFTPKFLSIILIALSPEKRKQFGGVTRVTLSVILETLLSTLLAPLRMIFHTWYVILNLIGQKLTWGTQGRLLKKTSFKEALRAHGPATIGALVWAGGAYAINETLFWWVSMTVAPLILGIPISIIYSYSSVGIFFRKLGLFLTPPETTPSPVLRRYQDLLKNVTLRP